MNYIFISPNFPKCYENFCNCLNKQSVTVLGIGDAPYDELSPMIIESLTEYYKVDSLADYDQVYRAVAFFAFKYGKIDWIDSHNEFWLPSDAKLREDFNVNTGVKGDSIYRYIRKSLMHRIYIHEMLPTAPQINVTDLESALKFAGKVGYPVVVKPDIGVGASSTWKLEDEKMLKKFFKNLPDVPYVMEKFLYGRIDAYNVIIDENGDIVFEQFMDCDPILDTVTNDEDFVYMTIPEVPYNVRMLCTKLIKALEAKAGFAHIELICLDRDYPGIGKKGDFSILEHNMRPPGGYTLDMMNYAGSCDVYNIYAKIISGSKEEEPQIQKQYYCVYTGRKDRFNYALSHEEVMEKYGKCIVVYKQMEKNDWKVMGKYMYLAKFRSMKKAKEFMADTTRKKEKD